MYRTCYVVETFFFLANLPAIDLFIVKKLSVVAPLTWVAGGEDYMIYI